MTILNFVKFLNLIKKIWKWNRQKRLSRKKGFNKIAFAVTQRFPGVIEVFLKACLRQWQRCKHWNQNLKTCFWRVWEKNRMSFFALSFRAVLETCNKNVNLLRVERLRSASKMSSESDNVDFSVDFFVFWIARQPPAANYEHAAEQQRRRQSNREIHHCCARRRHGNLIWRFINNF